MFKVEQQASLDTKNEIAYFIQITEKAVLSGVDSVVQFSTKRHCSLFIIFVEFFAKTIFTQNIRSEMIASVCDYSPKMVDSTYIALRNSSH